jgi:hypothetical protein
MAHIIRTVFSFLALALLFSACGTASKTASVETTAQAESSFTAYTDAFSNASKAAAGDDFDKYFHNRGVIALKGGDELKNLNLFKVEKDGTIITADFDRKLVEKYDAEGKNKTAVGKQGNEPGSYLFPTDVVETNDSSIAVADFQGHRVNTFAGDGAFISSFIYTTENFSAQRLIYDQTGDSFYLFGNRWQNDEHGHPTGADLIHKYSSKGEYGGSFLQFPEAFKALDLYNYDFPAVDISEGNVYAALPFDYKIYRVDKSGEFSVFLTGEKSDFKAPATKLDASKVARPDTYKFVQSWLLTWTPIVNLAVAGDNLIVQYQTFSPLRYTTDVWSVSTKKLKTSFKTNHLMLSRGPDKSIYFLKNLTAKEQPDYEIIRAEIK